MLSVVEKVILLQDMSIFLDVSTRYLSYLAGIAEEMFLPRGETIYKEDDPGGAMYVVLEGQVRLHRGDQELVTVSSKEGFGTWALLDDQPRVTTATAVADVRLLRIEREDFLDLLSDHVQVVEGDPENAGRATAQFA